MNHSDPIPLADSTDADWLKEIKQFRDAFSRFMLNYQFAMDEIMTKINILKTEFQHLHEYSPIEHVGSRLKSPESILRKLHRRGFPVSTASLNQLHDIAGIRVVCSFISDAYWVAEMLSKQADVTVVEVKDYIAAPKPNGYKSLHLIVRVPVFLSESVEEINVEVQIRTVAMDFWASLEHKIYYKFDTDIPDEIRDELSDAAAVANRLDVQMERIHEEVRARRPAPGESATSGMTFSPKEILAQLMSPGGWDGESADE